MRRPEQRFWDRARRILSRHRHLERIENLVVEGMPDVIVLNSAGEAGAVRMLELKAVQDWPKLPGTSVLGHGKGLSQEQMNWHKTWNLSGGKSGVLIGIGSREQVYIDGALADEVNAMTQSELRAHGATRWTEILRKL